MKTRTTIIIILTLLIGFILGFFISGRLAHHRMKRFKDMMDRPHKEQQHLMELLKLTEEQRTQIQPILDSMLPMQLEIRNAHKAQMDSARDAMFSKIKPYLNEVQLNKVERMKQRMERMKHRKTDMNKRHNR